jgi:transposase
MSAEEFIAGIGKWEGYCVASVETEPGAVIVELKGDAKAICSGCGNASDRLHDTRERWIRDLPILQAKTWLRLWRRRVDCSLCGRKVEAVPWLDRYSRVTRRLAESVARLAKVLSVKHVAEYFGLGWHTVKQIDKAYLEETLGPIDLSSVELIVMDEFAIQKGHRYATVVVEAESKRVLWVGRGRGREDVRPFFELLGEGGCRRLKAVAMDMNGAYEAEVRAHCPQVEIVYDLFHVVSKYAREVVDRVRVDEANRLRHDKKARKIVKGARWLLLRNSENLKSHEERVRLKELLGANRRLLTVYLLKDDLKHLWDYVYPGAAQRFWEGWYSRAVRSRIEPLKVFARKLKEYLPGILAHCRWPLHTSLLEGINNKIKVIKRMAYGFRDDEYFFLKIRAAFPGVARVSLSS